jgi:heat shock protein HtpX
MNTLKTTMLLALLTALLVFVGGLIGGIAGAAIFLVIAGAMNFFAYWFSDKMALKMAGARQVSESEEPHLHNMIREVANLAGMPMPKVYVVQADTPNAFATGRNPQHAVVAVTTGILKYMPQAELEGVIAHELAHIKNRDMLIATVAAGMAGALSNLPYLLMFGGGQDDDGGHPFAQIALILLAPIGAMLIQFAVSRQREFEADRVGALILGRPMPLANALIRLDDFAHKIPMHVPPAAAPLAQVNPLAAHGGVVGKLFSTHPPTAERVARLEAMVLGS